MNLTELAHAQGIHRTAYRWYREGALPVPAQNADRLILVSPDTAAATSPQNGRQLARNRGLKAVGCAQRDIGPRAVLGAGSARCGGAG